MNSPMISNVNWVSHARQRKIETKKLLGGHQLKGNLCAKEIVGHFEIRYKEMEFGIQTCFFLKRLHLTRTKKDPLIYRVYPIRKLPDRLLLSKFPCLVKFCPCVTKINVFRTLIEEILMVKLRKARSDSFNWIWEVLSIVADFRS